jgi:GNAT superfamily N-acetyltransferase
MGEHALIKSVITYLEMTDRPTSPTPARPAQKIALLRAENPTVSYYRYLYDTVGQDYFWWERRKMSDSDISDVISDNNVEIYTLFVAGVPAGYGELDRRNEPDIELAYFGLFPEFIGKGLGGYFLRWMIDQAWSYDPKRLFVHTCTEDHPAAIHNYQRHGFTPYDQVVEEIQDPATTGLFD